MDIFSSAVKRNCKKHYMDHLTFVLVYFYVCVLFEAVHYNHNSIVLLSLSPIRQWFRSFLGETRVYGFCPQCECVIPLNHAEVTNCTLFSSVRSNVHIFRTKTPPHNHPSLKPSSEFLNQKKQPPRSDFFFKAFGICWMHGKSYSEIDAVFKCTCICVRVCVGVCVLHMICSVIWEHVFRFTALTIWYGSFL